MFLIDIRYKKQIHITHSKPEWILETIEQILRHLEVDKVVFANNRLNFTSRFNKVRPRDHWLRYADTGYFEYNKVTSTITYNISTLKDLIFSFFSSSFLASIISLYKGSFSMFVFIFLFYFSGIYGIGWIMTASRQRRFLNKLAKDFEIYSPG